MTMIAFDKLGQIDREDIESACNVDFVPWEKLRGRTVFITGATGLIGHTLINLLLYANRTKGLNIKIVALVRDEQRARERFSGLYDDDELLFLVGSVEQLPRINMHVDYIVHGASQTASKSFVSAPVETILTAALGTQNVLSLAKDSKVSGLVYLSSMEIYGFPHKGKKISENEVGEFSTLDVRNSYPISKMLCESLCCSYFSEYNVPAKIIRLTQTFGPGINYNDGRIFAEIARCVLEKRDILLKTKGETERSYLYTVDAATAVLTVLLEGIPGQAYNAADESTYSSIAEMAERIAAMYGIRVRYELENERELGYPKTLYMDLDTQKLRGLGWRVISGGYSGIQTLDNMYRRMIFSLAE